MIRIPVHNTITTPSQDFIKYQTSLQAIAAYAKAAHQAELYNQAKETHDKLVRQYNEQNAPKKKGFWEQFKDNLTLNMDTHVTFYASYLEEDIAFKTLYEGALKLPQSKLMNDLRQLLDYHNSLFK
jgi:LPS O-antigen subunit length determinant protein (WzzB/FepE family)